MERRYDMAVIGAGLSGLCCAYILLKEGYSVCVIEKQGHPGGAFQSFHRGDLRLDTGFHYAGGVGEGEMMRPFISYFGMENLPWVRMDDNCFEEVYVRGRKFTFRNGFDNFRNDLVKEFPEDISGIDSFMDVLRHLEQSIDEALDPSWNVTGSRLFSTSAYEFLNSNIKSPLLRDVLCGGSATTELTEDLPLYSFAQSLASFIQGSYRIDGGGQKIIDSLAESVRSMGGEIFTGMKADRLILSGTRCAEAVECDGETFRAEKFISTIHPALTVGLIPDTPAVRGIYRKRIRGLANSAGMFTVHLQLRPGRIPYCGKIAVIHEKEDLWHHSPEHSGQVGELLVNFNVPQDGGKSVLNIDLLTPMSWDEVSRWDGTAPGNRPDDYILFKEETARRCIDLAERYVPQLKGNIERFWTSTPLTYRDWTGTVEGSAFGVRKSSRNLMGTMLPAITPLENLYISGQNLNLHGMLGTMITAFKTCSAACGKAIRP